MSSVPSAARLKYVLVAAFLVFLVFAFREAQWYVFETRIFGCLTSMPGKPTAQTMVSVRQSISDQARSLWISPSSLVIELRLEQHDSPGRALKEDTTEFWWFVVATVRGRGHVATWERRAADKLPETDAAELEQAGVKIVRRAP